MKRVFLSTTEAADRLGFPNVRHLHSAIADMRVEARTVGDDLVVQAMDRMLSAIEDPHGHLRSVDVEAYADWRAGR